MATCMFYFKSNNRRAIVCERLASVDLNHSYRKG